MISTYCGNYPDRDHTNCPSSVECATVTLADIDDAPAPSLSGVVTSTNMGDALDFDTYEDAEELAATIGAPLDMIQRVTFGDGRTVWHVIVLTDGRATWVSEF